MAQEMLEERHISLNTSLYLLTVVKKIGLLLFTTVPFGILTTFKGHINVQEDLVK